MRPGKGRYLLCFCFGLSLVFVGCGGDPASSRLTIGQQVTLVGGYPEEELAKAGFKDPGQLVVTSEAMGAGMEAKHHMVAAGTRARVVKDVGDGPMHKVMVHIIEGESDGVTGVVVRRQCVPVE